eukprot:GHVU01174961.1.p1 GENE.GHVU01174961.1~~GHVU01174961.1.p1  ORF type:complete len:135 (-),score=4.77 GHVU01174961.1:898-1302(-)
MFRKFSRTHIIDPAIAPNNINGWEEVMFDRNMWGKPINTFIISEEKAIQNSITEAAENDRPDDYMYSNCCKKFRTVCQKFNAHGYFIKFTCKTFRIVCLIFNGHGHVIKFRGYRFLLVAVDGNGIPMHLEDFCK